MPIELSAPYVDLVFMSPLSDRRAGRLVDFLSAATPQTVLDAGCGWAELLLRVLASCPDADGVGIDSDAGSIERGRALAVDRQVNHRLTLIRGDASVAAPTSADAVICIGASQIWGAGPDEAGSFTQPLDYRRALTAIRELVAPGGRVVYGESIWSTEPTPAAIAPLAGRVDEFVGLAELVEIAVDCGFAPLAVHQADLDEWDTFESGYAARYARWLADHDHEDPEAIEVRRRAELQRAAYLRGYRGVLGMAYLELLTV